MFFKIASTTIFGLITHIIKLFQTICKFKQLGLKLLVKMSLKIWCKTSFDEYITERSYSRTLRTSHRDLTASFVSLTKVQLRNMAHTISLRMFSLFCSLTF